MLSIYIVLLVFVFFLVGCCSQYVNIYVLRKRPDIVDRFQYSHKQQIFNLELFGKESSGVINRFIYVFLKFFEKIKFHYFFIGGGVMYVLDLLSMF